MVPEFEIVKIRNAAGNLFSITPHTQRIDLSSLREGQTVVCTVTRELPRVLRAKAL